MGAKSTVAVRFTGNVADLQRSIGKVNGSLASIGKVGAAAFAAVGVAAVGVGVGLFKIGETFDEQYDKIRVGTGATGAALDDLKDSFKNVLKTVPASFDDAGSAIADLNTRLGLTGKELEDVSTRILDLSRLTKTDVAVNVDNLTRVFGDWSIATDDQAESLDKMFRLAQSTGIGIDDLAFKVVQFGSPLRNLGFSFEEAAALFGKFQAEGVNTETVLAGLKQGLGNFAKAGLDPKQALADVIAEIKAFNTAGEAMPRAIDAFGKRAAPDLVAAIREGKFELADLVDVMDNGSDTIRGAAKDTESFSEKWTMFKNKVLIGLEPVATRVFEAVGNGMDRLSAWWDENGPGIVQWVKDFADSLEKNLGPAFAAVAGFLAEQVLPRLADLAVWVANNKPVLIALAALVGGVLVAAFLSWAASAALAAAGVIAATWPALALIGVVAGLTLGTQWLIDKFNLLPKASTAFQWVLDNGVAPLVRAIQSLIREVKRAWNLLSNPPSLTDIIPGAGNTAFSADQINRARNARRSHTGSIVPGPTGADVPMVLQAGQGVFTKDQMAALGGRGGGQQPVNVTIELDGQVLGRAMIRFDADYRSANGRPAFSG